MVRDLSDRQYALGVTATQKVPAPVIPLVDERRPLWRPGQGFICLLLAAWNVTWLGVLVFSVITRHVPL